MDRKDDSESKEVQDESMRSCAEPIQQKVVMLELIMCIGVILAVLMLFLTKTLVYLWLGLLLAGYAIWQVYYLKKICKDKTYKVICGTVTAMERSGYRKQNVKYHLLDKDGTNYVFVKTQDGHQFPTGSALEIYIDKRDTPPEINGSKRYSPAPL